MDENTERATCEANANDADLAAPVEALLPRPGGILKKEQLTALNVFQMGKDLFCVQRLLCLVKQGGRMCC